MAQKTRGLGRGLSALMADVETAETAAPRRADQMMPVDQIVPNPDQPRRTFTTEQMEELAASIKEKGVIQPLIVRAIAGGQYEIVAGERRWRAAQLAHKIGAKLLLDGCQAARRLAIDVAAMDCDFYVFSSHKLYGPTGIGVLWARQEILDAMPPWEGGGAMIDRVTFDKTTYAPPPQRFEAGTPAIAEAIGLAAAIDYVESIGLDAIHAREAALVERLRRELLTLNDMTLFGPADSAGIVSFAMRGVHPHDLGTILDENNVAIRAGHHCAQPLMDHLGVPATARASFGLYNVHSDVDALLEGIARTRKIFG